MIIKTLNRVLMVIRVVSSNADTDVQVCRDLLDASGMPYTVVRIKDQALGYDVIPFFLAQKENTHFTDLIDCFSEDGHFHVLFRHSYSPTLRSQIEKNAYTLPERLEIGKNLLTRLTLEDMPPGIQQEVLSDENLLMDDALGISFFYNLRHLKLYHVTGGLSAQTQLVQVFERLFETELQRQLSPDLEAFLAQLATEKFADNLAVYAAYDALYQKLSALHTSGGTQPQGLLFRIWERITRLARYVRPTLAGMAVAAAFIYLIYTIAVPEPKSEQAVQTIKSIGTVSLGEADAV